MFNPSMLRDIPIGQMHIRELCFGLLIHLPSDDPHLGRIPKPVPLPGYQMFLMRAMDQIVTRLTKRNEVIRAIAACLATLDVVDIQNFVLGFASTPLTSMPIPKQHIFTHIPESELGSLLVLSALYLRMLDLLDVKLGDFDGGLPDGQDLLHEPDRFQMDIHRVLDRGWQPARWFLSVVETSRTVSCLAASSCPTKLLTRCQKLLNISAGLHFCLKQDRLF